MGAWCCTFALGSVGKSLADPRATGALTALDITRIYTPGFVLVILSFPIAKNGMDHPPLVVGLHRPMWEPPLEILAF